MLSISQFSYAYQARSVLAIDEFHLPRGQHALLLGPSGSGKSTLLHLLAAVLTPQQGRIEVGGINLSALAPRAADAWRGRNIGFLPQQLALISSLSARDNVLLPAYASNQAPDFARAASLLASLDLADKIDSYPHQLSQGQRQRVAIARAMYLQPSLILADEPTANLDDQACATVVRLLVHQARQANASLVIASHDARLIAALPEAKILRLPASGSLS
ncbi:ABC transporter ATP-binding protein [Janthinobacterium agaricidamnosum]|uniref:ABC transporter family protein n=1 Tax=Janthinobacterium agaricidamnosum NBRC 102515 = DSM 9628 TaxID=1349767 RepID=W0V7B5_9BURK|nr:ATP-binding cassette domain-containing protein [Janthinobacterium agaricidamnosum]CDG83248.1 ABC transporter family protein [Janthinobacterium agaricidamnosum NBRC 102515 = DSM 9628]